MDRRRPAAESERELRAWKRINNCLMLLAAISTLTYVAWVTRPASPLWEEWYAAKERFTQCRILMSLHPEKSARDFPVCSWTRKFLL